jgi:hypothetical protein
MRKFFILFLLLLPLNLPKCEDFKNRWVWIFGFNIQKNEDVEKIKKILEEAKENNYNGAVLSGGLDSLCKKDEKYFKNLKEVKDYCEKLNLKLIPSVFSIGYGGKKN